MVVLWYCSRKLYKSFACNASFDVKGYQMVAFLARLIRNITPAFAVLIFFVSPLQFADATTRPTDTKQTEAGSDISQIELIDTSIRKVWDEFALKPSKKAPDLEWCRRVHLDVVGRIPTVGELSRFMKDRPAERRQKLVARLLYSDEYKSDYVRHWSTVWSNVLIGRSGGLRNNSLISREGMKKYLREVFAENRPYNQMVRELVSANGTTAPEAEGFNGATNFLVMKLAENATQATATTSRVFLGLQIQCTQCHNHPFNDWKQQKFWEMNSFFRQTVALRRFEPGTRDIRFVELANQDFGGEGNTPEEAEIYYEMRNGYLKPAYPTFVDGEGIERSGFVEDVNRRDRLAELIVESEYLATAQVNRHWSHFLGHGFTRPIDDMGPHNAASHPELLKHLASEFRENNYDLKKLTQWIVLSEAYSLSSRTTSNNASDDPLLGEAAKFSHFYMRQMTAEQLYESLLVATEADRTGSPGEREENQQKWMRQFVRAFGTDEGGESTTFDGTISQQLMMFNGDLIRNAIDPKKEGVLGQVVASEISSPKKIRHLYLAALSRPPSTRELNVANRVLVASKGNVVEALQDVWWAVLNSNEFILNH